jgi:hypothetical protein
MKLQCLSQRFTYSSERHILERRGPPRGGSSRSGEGSSQARDRVGQAAHLEDPAGGVVVLGEHARVLEVPFSSNLLEGCSKSAADRSSKARPLCRAYEWPHRSGSISYALTRIF